MRTRIVLAVAAVACISLGADAAAATVERGGKLPKLTQPKAERFAKQSVQSKFEYFSYYNGKVIRCNKRVSRVRLRCKVKWWVGDSSAKGKVTVWYRWKRGDVWWYSRGKVKLLDTYCALDKPKSQCTDIKKWGH
jgi:hypothetical protein